MSEPSQPRINPSDWASRRKNAMNRAQELRAKKKEVDLNQDSSTDLSSLASQSEIQRQRRSRQLEATQKLLDGQVSSLKSTESLSGRSVGNKSFGDGVNGQQNENRGGRESALIHAERPIGGSSNGTHSIIPQKQLGHIHRQYQDPAENISVASHSNITADVDLPTTLNESKRAGNSNKLRLEDATEPTLREMPLEGRGRGRGRGRSHPSLSGGTVGLGEVFGSTESLSRVLAVDKEEVVFKSRSPTATRIHSSSSQSLHSRPKSVDAVTKSLQSYLRGRQVPEFKEGDCAKLTILRQRLVARRRKREMSNKAGLTGRIVQSSQSQRTISTEAESSLGNDSRSGEISRSDEQFPSGEELDPNEYTARDFQRADMQQFERTSMDASQISDVQSDKVDGGDDDEASVVNIELIQCDCCKRKFAPKIYERHFDSDGQPKCAKVVDKKRPVYNAAMVRIANNDNLNKDEQTLALQVSLNQNTKAPKKKSKKSSKWREESVAFREAMKANRLMSQAEKKDEIPRHKKHGKSRGGR